MIHRLIKAQPQGVTTVTELIDDFKEFYRDFRGVELRAMSQLYDEKVRFKDPIHTLQGLPDLHAYLESLAKNLEFCRFEYLDQVMTSDRAYIKWNMNFRHPKLCSKTLTVRGVTHIEFADRIHYHEDIYDVGEMLYEHLPFIGLLTRIVKSRVA